MTKPHTDFQNFSDNTQKPVKRRSGPKMFQCTGYGECKMVFTRQEHLNRHERKHTGEKPYQCTVPECPRMFTRNDNMRQHAERCPYNNNSRKKSYDKPTMRKRYSSESTSDDISQYEQASSPSDSLDEQSLYTRQHIQRRRSTPRVIFASHPYKPWVFNHQAKPKRRLSADDLFRSIDLLEEITNSSCSEDEDTVDLTEDEYEALLGFKELHKAAVISNL